MSEEQAQKKILYRTVSGRENSRWIQDNEEKQFQNVAPVKHPNYGYVYPDRDEDWSGTAYAQGQGVLSPETTTASAAKNFRFIDVGSMNNPLMPVSHRRVTERPIETPAVPKAQLSRSAANTISGSAPSTFQPQANYQNGIGYSAGAQSSAANMNGTSEQNSNPKRKLIKIKKKNNIMYRYMTPKEEIKYSNVKSVNDPDWGEVYPSLDQEWSDSKSYEFVNNDLSTLFDENNTKLTLEQRGKVMDGLNRINNNWYYNQMLQNLNGQYGWQMDSTINAEAQFGPRYNTIKFKNNETILPQNLEEELIHAAQKQTYGMDTMYTNYDKYNKSIELEAKAIQDCVRKMKSNKDIGGQYPVVNPMKISKPEYDRYLNEIINNGGFTTNDLPEYYRIGTLMTQVPGTLDPNFVPKLLLQYFGKPQNSAQEKEK